MFSLKNKTAVITGGGSGIGKAMATLFARQGASVFIIDMDDQAALATLNEINDKRDVNEQANGIAFYKHCDISKQQQVIDTFKAIGQIDILVNNAGIAHIGTAESTSEADFDKVINVNIKGAYNCLFAAIPLMKAKGGGVILNTGSIAASVGIPDRFAYSTSKGAVLAMTLSVARDYLRDNIRCNSISPARVHTPFVDGFIAKTYPDNQEEMFDKLSKSQPIGRMGKPEEVAALALYLCSDEAGFITGCDYPIDGGFTKINT
jgi:2-keto-3-deoxy-L-fuconate dehydrogenase